MYLADDTTRLAEAFLSLCTRDPTAPFYTEAGLRRRLRQERARPALGPAIRNEATTYLLEREWAAIVIRARLTALQREVFGKRLCGWTFEEIGGRRGHTRQSAQRVFSQALRKLMAAWRTYEYRGLTDVYRLEVRRGGGTMGGK